MKVRCVADDPRLFHLKGGETLRLSGLEEGGSFQHWLFEKCLGVRMKERMDYKGGNLYLNKLFVSNIAEATVEVGLFGLARYILGNP